MASLQRWLSRIENAGNRLPHPAVLFITLSVIVVIASGIASFGGSHAIHPVSGERIDAVNLLSGAGLLRILNEAVSNFTQFAPVGVVLVVMLGIGVAEHSGLIQTALRRLVSLASTRSLPYIVALAGVLSSLAFDAGYVVLIPLAGLLYQAAGKPAVAGIAVAFAGVSAGFSANLLIGPVDLVLAGISTEAAQLYQSDYQVEATDNYYFILISTLMITVVCGLVSEKLVEPLLSHHAGLDDTYTSKTNAAQAALNTERADSETANAAQTNDAQSLIAAGIATLSIIVVAALLLWPDQGPLHKACVDAGISPLRLLVPALAIGFAIVGYAHGRSNRRYQSLSDAVVGMEASMKTMASYIVLMFFAAQFVSYFSWSQLGLIFAIRGADLLGSLQLGPVGLVLGLITLTATINLFVGSASAKWSVMAPVFVPMFMLLGIAPEVTQIAYRIGDSTTNIITPLMPYFGIVLAYTQRHQASAGMGTIAAMMLPFSLTLILCWSALLMLWISVGLPLGPGANLYLPQ